VSAPLRTEIAALAAATTSTPATAAAAMFVIAAELVFAGNQVDAGDRRRADVHYAAPCRALSPLLLRRIGSEVGPPTVNSRDVAPGTPDIRTWDPAAVLAIIVSCSPCHRRPSCGSSSVVGRADEIEVTRRRIAGLDEHAAAGFVHERVGIVGRDAIHEVRVADSGLEIIDEDYAAN
jgi:hypothetical protein